MKTRHKLYAAVFIAASFFAAKLAQSAEAVMPIKATIINCGTRENLNLDDPRCLVFVEPSAGDFPDGAPVMQYEVIMLEENVQAYVETEHRE